MHCNQQSALVALVNALRTVGLEASASPRFSQARGIPVAYHPVKVGWRSPITVYETKRGQFDELTDAAVRVCLDTRPDAIGLLAGVRARLQAFAEENGCGATADPGDPRKTGWIMTPSQVVAALDVKREEKRGEAPLAAIVQPTVEDAEWAEFQEFKAWKARNGK